MNIGEVGVHDRLGAAEHQLAVLGDIDVTDRVAQRHGIDHVAGRVEVGHVPIPVGDENVPIGGDREAASIDHRGVPVAHVVHRDGIEHVDPVAHAVLVLQDA